jgi:hypothetical protein
MRYREKIGVSALGKICLVLLRDRNKVRYIAASEVVTNRERKLSGLA